MQPVRALLALVALCTAATTHAQLTLLSRLGWKVSASSEATPDFPASAAIDGSTTSFWHTVFGATFQPPPHSLTVTFVEGDLHTVDGITYLPRPGNAPHQRNGRVQGFQVLVSTDGTTFEPAALADGSDSGTLPDTPGLKEIPFQAPIQNVAAVQLLVTSAYGPCGNRCASVADLGISGYPGTTPLGPLASGSWAVWANSWEPQYPVSRVLDGDPETFWHTKFTQSYEEYRLVIDFAPGVGPWETYYLTELTILPGPWIESTNGLYEVELEFDYEVEDFPRRFTCCRTVVELEDNAELKTITLSPPVRFAVRVELTIKSTANPGCGGSENCASIAEITVIGTPEPCISTC